MVWEKLKQIKSSTIPIDEASNEEVSQNMKDLLKLRQCSNPLNPTKIHFKNVQHVQEASICSPDYNDYTINMNERKPENININSNCLNSPCFSGFYWNEQNSTLYFIDTNSDDKEKVVANFKCELNQRIIEIELNGTEKYFTNITIFYRQKEYSITVDITKEFISEIRLFPEFYIKDNNKFKEYLSTLYGDYAKDTFVQYNFSGWYKLNLKNSTTQSSVSLYLNNSMSNVKAPIALLKDKDCVNSCCKFLALFFKTSTNYSHLLMILLYSLYCYFAYFYEINFLDGLRSLLYISAPTGTGKTSLIKILAKALYVNPEDSILRFDDTIASLEEGLFNRRDVLTLIDDFYAQGNKFDDQAFKTKASMITRIIGDGRIKGKMGADRKLLPDRKYRGGIIATGEFIDLNTHSSYLRCWHLNFEANSIKLDDNLSQLQQSPQLAQSFFSSWIYWLEKNQNTIIQELYYIHSKFLNECLYQFKEPYPRFCSNVAAFLSINHFFAKFCSDFKLTYNEEENHHLIINEAFEQLEMLHEYSPTEIFIKAIKDALDNDYLKIATNEENFIKRSYDGFTDEQYLMIISSKLDDVIERYTFKRSYGLKITSALKTELVQKNILVSTSNDFTLKYTKNRQVTPKRPRIYKFRKEVFYNEL